MAEVGKIHNYKSLSLDDLYTALCCVIADMCNLTDGKQHKLFMEKKKEIELIRTIIEEKKKTEKINPLHFP